MIQRIQSVYLFIALVLNILIFTMPFAEVSVEGGAICKISHNGIYSLDDQSTPSYVITAIVAVICLLTLMTIFQYKRRLLQMRLCTYNLILSLATLGLMAYSMWFTLANIEVVNPKAAAIFPLLSSILFVLAWRAVRNDDKLIKSVDRIR